MMLSQIQGRNLPGTRLHQILEFRPSRGPTYRKGGLKQACSQNRCFTAYLEDSRRRGGICIGCRKHAVRITFREGKDTICSRFTSKGPRESKNKIFLEDCFHTIDCCVSCKKSKVPCSPYLQGRNLSKCPSGSIQ